MPVKVRHLLFVILALAPTWAGAAIDHLEHTYRFLVSSREPAGGALGISHSDGLKGRLLPFSFFDTADYWGAYVCGLPGSRCAVTDIYNAADYSLAPPQGLPGELQVERVNTHNGSNIYDAATWQIAVMLGRVKHGFASGDVPAYELASNQNRALTLPVKRALSDRATFLYNGAAITAPAHAYAFRMQADRYIATDPLMGTRYASLVRAQGLPPASPDYVAGRITWTDWKPFTGENAWAFLLGPLHAAYLHYIVEKKQAFVPFDELAIRNALDVLPTFARMQSPVGGVYYAPSGTFANQGKKLVSPYFVSVENNASLYAGLQVLRATLLAQVGSAGRNEQQRIRAALEVIQVMIHGGRVGTNRPTAGLLSFFRHAAWRDHEFVQGGYANDPERANAWEPVTSPKAVDVNTWTVAALGPQQVDAWFGFGEAFEVWQRVKGWGGYGEGQVLWGVGYSEQDGNGRDEAGAYRRGVLSSEWTAGAIVMARSMIDHYRAVPRASAQYAAAQDYMRVLEQDEASMLKGVQTLRYDQYLRTPFPGKPERYAELIPQRSLPYLYASRRAFVPFGWQANPIPSTCSSAWTIMLASRFDPFRYGGGLGVEVSR